jgi:hypothetical protein
MTQETGATGLLPTCTFELASEAVEAGMPFTLICRVAAAKEPRDAWLSVTAADGSELARAALKPEGAAGHSVCEVSVPAPLETGSHVYRGVILAEAKDGPEELAAAPIAFEVIAHPVIASSWDVPSATPAGERLAFKVGFRCSCGCSLAGLPFQVLAGSGEEIAAGRLAGDIWPQTEALYFAAVETAAPSAPGDYAWSVAAPAFAEGMPHAEAKAALAVKIVAAPDFDVTVEVVDAEQQRPVAGAHVFMHPYRAFTDEQGIARFRVARGPYRLVVSGFKYVPYQQEIDATADLRTSAELRLAPEANYWNP